MTDLDIGDVARAASKALEALANRPPAWKPLPHQVPPPGDWYGWLLNAGRGSGKTDAVAHYVTEHVKGPACLRGPVPHWIGIIAPTLGDAVTSCFAGPSGLRAHDPTVKLVQGAGGTLVRWSNNSEAKLFGAHEPEDVERLRAGGNRCARVGTLVSTERGSIPIEQVRPGERVWTRAGLQRVLATHHNGRRPIWRVTTTYGMIDLTSDHEVATPVGWCRVDQLSIGSIVTAWRENTLPTPTFIDTSVIAGTTPTHDEDYYTATSTSTKYGRSYLDNRSIIEITTRETTTQLILKRCIQVNTRESIWDEMFLSAIDEPDWWEDLPVSIRNFVSHNVFEAQSANTAVVLPTTLTETRATAMLIEPLNSARKPRHGVKAHTRNECVACAETSSHALSGVQRSFADESANRFAFGRNDSTNLVRLKNDDVSSVKLHTSVSDPKRHAPVHASVLTVSPLGFETDVYDLTVENCHEFIANGIIISNCLVWVEELAAWRYLQQCWEQMRFGLRVGPHPRWVGSTTPKPRPLIKKLVKQTPTNVVVTQASTRDNPHLESEVKAALQEEYGGTQLGRQELEAELLEEDRDALWRRDTLDRFRLVVAPDRRVRTVVGVDPSGGAGEQGIVVVAKVEPSALRGLLATAGAYAGGPDVPMPKPGERVVYHGVVLDDRTCCLSPHGWGRRAVQAAIDWDADELVVERNFGGAMATSTLVDACDALGVMLPVKEVVASRGKRVRAEPVSALSERGRWHMAGSFAELEDQLATWTPESGYSPDRLDAMVWPAWYMRLVSTTSRGVGHFATGLASVSLTHER